MSTEKKNIYLLGLSGGADSVYLFHHFLREGVPFHAAHFNHGWRTDAADDATFCKKLCAQHNIPFYLGHAADYTKKIPTQHQKNNSLEARARYQRRAFLEDMMRQHNLAAIALAHHQDDQVGTLLLRLMRGTTLAGIGGMQKCSGSYYRPLLHLSKKEIIDYLDKHQLTYRSDSSNNDSRFLRNRINHQLLPTLQKCDERALHNVARSMQSLKEENEFLHHLVSDLYVELVDNNNALPLPTLRRLHPVLLRRLLLHFLIAHNVPFTPSKGLLAEIIRFVQHQRGGSHTIGEGIALKKNRGVITITTPR
jgi:tRNA(Ile)-lysidine synthase